MYIFISRVLLLVLGFTTIHCSKISFKAKENPNVSTPVTPSPPVILPPPVIRRSGKLDLLIVIDNSSSMLPEHSQMSEKLSGIISKLSLVDYRVAVTTTDARSQIVATVFGDTKKTPRGFGGKAISFDGQNFVSSNTVNVEQVLLNSLDRSLEASCGTIDDGGSNYWEEDAPVAGLCSIDEEEPTKVIAQFLNQKNTVNSGFLRQDASFVALIITDEDIETADKKIVDVSLDLSSIKLLQPNFKAYGVIAQATDQSCQANWSGELSTKVQKFINLSGGSHNSICDESYTAILDKIISDL